MVLLLDLLNRVLFFALFFAILIVIKEIFLFVIAYKKQEKLNMDRKRQIILGSAISYILMFIFTGLL